MLVTIRPRPFLRAVYASQTVVDPGQASARGTCRQGGLPDPVNDPRLGRDDWEMLLASRHLHGVFRRTLCSLRMVSQALTVRNAGQVNVRAQQVRSAVR